jgi:hypothetical protein
LYGATSGSPALAPPILPVQRISFPISRFQNFSTLCSHCINPSFRWLSYTPLGNNVAFRICFGI